jgi:hypothetical protein
MKHSSVNEGQRNARTCYFCHADLSLQDGRVWINGYRSCMRCARNASMWTVRSEGANAA